MRAFVAFELPETVHRRLLAAGVEIRRLAPAWAEEKWVAPEALHVTLKFLGDVPPDRLDGVASSLRARAAGISPAPFVLDGLRAAPGRRRASMLWAVPSVEPASAARVADVVDEVATAFGVPSSDRAFRTHVTVVRARRPRRIAADVLQQAEAMLVPQEAGKDAVGIVSGSAVTVFTSTLTRSGPVYEVWDRVELGRA